MKNIAPIRKNLGVKTFFNMLGPMVNPAFPKKQLVGVFSLELARLYGYLYQQTDKQFLILHSLDGYDEISLTGDAKMINNEGERLITPEKLGMNSILPETIYGGEDIGSSARIFEEVIRGKGSREQTDVICANAGLALYCADPAAGMANAVERARESLLSGKALQSFKKLTESKPLVS